MKIKRFVAPDMRRAIRKVRQEQGPDAVILSNRRVRDGIEIIAAVDYDEGLIQEALGQSVPARQPQPQREESRVDPAPEADEDGVLNELEAALTEEEAPPAFAGSSPDAPAGKPTIVWSQEPTLVEMRQELKTLRTILESQLSSLIWNDLARRDPFRAEALRDLTSLGLAPDLAREIVGEMPALTNASDAWSLPLGALARRIPVSENDLMEQGGVVAIVGPTGVGKTTTIAKLAARFALRHGKEQVGLVSTDGYRIGAHDQLLTFGRILGVPVHTAIDSEALEQALTQLEERKLVLIDTAGMSPQDVRLSHQLGAVQTAEGKIDIYLTLAANSHIDVLDEVVRVFQQVPLKGCILTKLDEATTLGGALSTVVKHRLPIAFFADGQRVPEDIHAASKKRLSLVNRAVELMHNKGKTVNEEIMAQNFGEVAARAYA